MKINTLENYMNAYSCYLRDGKLYNHEKREEIRKNFHYSVVVEGEWPAVDNAARWCWNNISPEECEVCSDHLSEYPGCPLALETEYLESGTNIHEGKEYSWQTKCYKQPIKHGHKGNWRSSSVGKTGYDYGFVEFFFRNEEDKKRFESVVESIGLGENYF